MKYSWRLSGQAWFALLTLGLGLWLAVTYASLIMEIIWVLAGAFLLSLAITPLADILARRRIPRSLTVLGIYLGLIGLLIVLGVLLLPIISTETSLLQANGPDLLQKALSRLSTTPFVGRLFSSNDTLSQNLIQYIYALGPTFLSTVAGVGGIMLDLVGVLILAYFLAADTTIGQRVVHTLVPVGYQPQVIAVMQQLRTRLTRWVWAQVAIASYFAVTFGIGLAWLGVPFALTIALVGGILEIIPYVGGVVATVLGILSALTVAPQLAIWVLLLYMLVAEVQSHLVAPALYGRAIHLHPAAVLVSLLIGAKAKGLIGVFFAVPIVVVLLTLIQEIQTVSLTKNAQSANHDGTNRGLASTDSPEPTFTELRS